MRTYEELTAEDQEKAVNQCATDLLKAILDGGLRFDDGKNENNLQSRIDAACEEADRQQVPWFAHEFIMDTCKEEIMGMAKADAENSVYPDPSERVVLE